MKKRNLVSVPPTVVLKTTPIIYMFILLPWPLQASPVVNAAIPRQYFSETRSRLGNSPR